MASTLHKLASIFSRPLNQDSVPHLMILSRQPLEARGLKGKYSHLNFYCNWTLHTKLNQRNTVTELLDSLSEALSVTSGKNNYNDAVLEVIGLQHLRREFIACFENEGLPTGVFHSKSAWKHLLSILVEALLDKPIHRPQEDIPKAAGRYPVCAILLRLAHRGDPALKSFGIPTDWQALWVCRIVQKDTMVVGPFNLPEAANAFRNS